jgi:putative ABC transport system permease protein
MRDVILFASVTVIHLVSTVGLLPYVFGAGMARFDSGVPGGLTETFAGWLLIALSIPLLTVLDRLPVLRGSGLWGYIAFLIRIGLGARSAQVFRLVVREGMLLVALGVALGLAGSFAATRFVSGLLFDVAGTDPNVFVAVTLALLGSGLAACVLPARRATRVDAMEALRSE